MIGSVVSLLEEHAIVPSRPSEHRRRARRRRRRRPTLNESVTEIQSIHGSTMLRIDTIYQGRQKQKAKCPAQTTGKEMRILSKTGSKTLPINTIYQDPNVAVRKDLQVSMIGWATSRINTVFQNRACRVNHQKAKQTPLTAGWTTSLIDTSYQKQKAPPQRIRHVARVKVTLEKEWAEGE